MRTVSFWCWTDSMIVLSWIKGNPGKWKPFVANRVSDIQELTAPSCWYHCASEHNPADLSTGGKLAEDLIASDLWCKGPTWLSRPFDVVDTCRYDTVELSREEQTVVVVVVAQDYDLIDYERFSSFSKFLRINAWVLGFMANSTLPNTQRITDELSFDELYKAKVQIFRNVQNIAYSTELTAPPHDCLQFPPCSSY